jgi:hypothetical protein
MAVMDADTGKLLIYRQLMRSTKYREAWSLSSANEFGRLANGIGGRIKIPPTPLNLYSNTKYQQIWAIRVHGATRKGRTKSNMVHCRGRQNQLPRRSCRGKNALQHVISMKEARFMTNDISNFYLMTPLHRPEFIRMKLSDIPNRRIQATRESHQKWQHLHQSQESIETIPTHCRQTTAFALSERTNSIWRQEAIRNTGIDGTFARRQGQMLHSTSM